MLDLALLGCGGSMPIPQRFLTSLLLSYKGKKILIDCGEGTQVSMKLLAWGFKSIDVICITHTHADHVLGLPGLLATIRNSERTEPLTIIGPKGINKVVQGLMVIVPYLGFDLHIIEAPQESLQIDENFTIHTIDLHHTVPCLGYKFTVKRRPRFSVEKAEQNEVPKIYWSRLQKGEVIETDERVYTPDLVLGEGRKGITLSYITDTRPFPELVDFVRESDLFIGEGMYGSDEDLEKAIRNKHMTFREAAEIAKAADVDELILTHFSPSLLNPEDYLEGTRSIFPNTHVGEDRLIRQLKFKNDGE